MTLLHDILKYERKHYNTDIPKIISECGKNNNNTDIEKIYIY